MKKLTTKSFRLLLALTALLVMTAMTSCSEEDDTPQEYDNWPARNDAWFKNFSDSVVGLISANPSQTEWKRIKTWSKPDSIIGANTDYILARVIESAPQSETASPVYTDTVKVHYTGRYIPSANYPTGYVFDRSYNEPFDAEISVPVQFAASGLVDGFTTALLHMRRGDHWQVIIPYQLAYGNPSTSSAIESGSTLIFDIRLVDFWAPKKN